MPIPELGEIDLAHPHEQCRPEDAAQLTIAIY
jgi:hypothetical protein